MAHQTGRSLVALLAAGVAGTVVFADLAVARPWVREPVEWRVTGGGAIRGILYPPDHPPPMRARQDAAQRRPRRQALRPEPSPQRGQPGAGPESAAVVALIVDSPPIDGFVPYITVSATSEKTSQDETSRQSTTVGPMLPARQADFTIGLFDTGAGAHVMGYAHSLRLGVVGSFLTEYEVEITGVTGSVSAWVSEPIGLYMDGLRAIDADTGTFTNADMVGQWNVAIAVGKEPEPGLPDLPMVVGSPMAVYYAAHVRNDQPLTRIVQGQEYTAPDISFHDPLDPSLPEYPIYVPLQLRPVGASEVRYIPCIEIFGECIITPTPSIIIGTAAQSLFFLGSVNLRDRTFQALDRTQFMLDTGAQVTVISRQTATVLGLNTNQPEFQVEIQGVDGQVTLEPGFFLDRLELPADGEWLTFTNVPVVVLDVASPEGGLLQGIIGMNLLTQYNFVLRGGGMTGQGPPSLECQVIVPPVVNADFDGDGDVDHDDFGHFQRCFTGPGLAQKSAGCVNARMDADSDVDAADLAIFAACASGPTIPASPECTGQ